MAIHNRCTVVTVGLTPAGSQQVSKTLRSRFPVHGFVGLSSEFLVQLPAGFLVGNGNPGGNAQHVFRHVKRDHHDTVPIAADDISGANQHTTASYGNIDIHQLDSARNDRPANPAAGHRIPLQDDLIGVTGIAIGDDPHRALPSMLKELLDPQ